MRLRISDIRACIESGMSDDEIEDALHEMELSAQEERDRFGDQYEDPRSTYEKEMGDRLDMGRNDAGEWLGFM